MVDRTRSNGDDLSHSLTREAHPTDGATERFTPARFKVEAYSEVWGLSSWTFGV